MKLVQVVAVLVGLGAGGAHAAGALWHRSATLDYQVAADGTSSATEIWEVRADTNALWDLASHDVSIALDWLGGAPTRVRASGHRFLPHAQDDVVFAELEFPDGVVVHLHVSWLDPCKVRRATVIG